MTAYARGQVIGTIKCPFCGELVEIKKSPQTIHGTCMNKKCKGRFVGDPRILEFWPPKNVPATTPDAKGRGSPGLSEPGPVAESPPTPPDNHEPPGLEPAVPEAAPVKAPPVAEPKAAEVLPKAAPTTPPPSPPVPDTSGPVRPSLFKIKLEAVPATPPPPEAPAEPMLVRSSLFKLKKKEESDNDRKAG